MNYAHYFRYAPATETFRKAWPRMVADAARIVGFVASTGVRLRSRTGWGAPEFGDVIAFNGCARHREQHQPFLIHPAAPTTARDPHLAYRYAATGFVARYCDTGRAPYDLAVTAVLLRCHQLAPTAFTISSDGDFRTEWAYGAPVWADHLIPRTAPPLPVAARTVVSTLFGDTEHQNPFTGDGPAERDPLPDPTTR